MFLLHTAWEGESCKKSRADGFSLCKLLACECAWPHIVGYVLFMSNYVNILHILSILAVYGVNNA